MGPRSSWSTRTHLSPTPRPARTQKPRGFLCCGPTGPSGKRTRPDPPLSLNGKTKRAGGERTGREALQNNQSRKGWPPGHPRGAAGRPWRSVCAAGTQHTQPAICKPGAWLLVQSPGSAGTLAPLCRGGLAGGVGLHDVGQLVDDQLQDLDQQRNVRPALRVWEGKRRPHVRLSLGRPPPHPRKAALLTRHSAPPPALHCPDHTQP